MLIGSVAKLLSGASMVPTMPAVATNTVALPPASACVTASTNALRRARRSPAAASTTGCARADIRVAPKRVSRRTRFLLAADPRRSQRAERRSEVQRTRMADHRRACLRWAQRTDLAERRFHLVDHEIDHVEWPFCAERAEAPQKGFAGKCGIGSQRTRAHHVEPRAHAAVQHHACPTADGASDGGKHVDGRR